VKFIRAVKADNSTLTVEKEFYEHFEHPGESPASTNETATTPKPLTVTK